MKKLFTLLILFSILGTLYAQIPNGNFENWKSATFEYPTEADWHVYNEELNPDETSLLEKSTDASDGTYAIKFTSPETDGFSYVVWGEVGGEDFSGIPFADDPTEVTIAFKGTLATGDTAHLWVFLYHADTAITEDMFKIAGTYATYTDLTFTLSDYTLPPDGIFVALVSTDPDGEELSTPGNEMYFDNLRLNGSGNVQIPDNSFEDWTSLVLEYTDQMSEIEALVEKSTDAHDGMYALKMSTQNAEWREAEEENDRDEVNRDSRLILWGMRDHIRTADDDWEDRIIGGIAPPARKDTLVFFYKYMHPNQVVDTANVRILFEKDSIEVHSTHNIMEQVDTWTKFEAPWDLDEHWDHETQTNVSVEADSMILELESTGWRNFWKESDVNVEGSALYVDFMYFASQAIYAGIEDDAHPENMISVFPNPTYDMLYIRGLSTVKNLEIISLNGALLYQDQITGNTSVDISEYPAGVYMIKLDDKLLGKIIKQ